MTDIQFDIIDKILAMVYYLDLISNIVSVEHIQVVRQGYTEKIGLEYIVYSGSPYYLPIDSSYVFYKDVL